MKKTYVTKMPDHIGAFLKASEAISGLGVNITRVSYNKAVDSHTLFIEVDGDEALCRKERSILLEMLGEGKWCIFGGHGQRKLYQRQP